PRQSAAPPDPRAAADWGCLTWFDYRAAAPGGEARTGLLRRAQRAMLAPPPSRPGDRVMLRRATPDDLPRICAIRDGAHEDPLSDPSVLTAARLASLLENGPIWLWEEPEGLVAGFAAADPGDGRVWALLVAPGHEGKGIGRTLLAAVCGALRAAG